MKSAKRDLPNCYYTHTQIENIMWASGDTLFNLTVVIILMCMCIKSSFCTSFKDFLKWHNPNICGFVNHFNKLKKKKKEAVFFCQYRTEFKM